MDENFDVLKGFGGGFDFVEVAEIAREGGSFKVLGGLLEGVAGEVEEREGSTEFGEGFGAFFSDVSGTAGDEGVSALKVDFCVDAHCGGIQIRPSARACSACLKSSRVSTWTARDSGMMCIRELPSRQLMASCTNFARQR